MNTDPISSVEGLQNEILEAIATGMEIEEVVGRLSLRAETLAPGVACAVSYIDSDGNLGTTAAPSLPNSYCNQLVGLSIALPEPASTKVRDRQHLPVMPDGSLTLVSPGPVQLPLPAGWATYWSSPITAPDGALVALFTFFYRDKRPPSEHERMIANACVRLAGIAIGHRRMEHRNLQLAYFDQLTALHNRRGFDERIQTKLNESTPSLALLLIDIDHLKTINDSMGHVVGDEVIKEVAGRMETVAIAAAASSYRLSGDEFAVLVDGEVSHDALRELAAKILNTMEAPFHCRGNMIVPRVTIGGVVFGPDGEDADILRQNADFALYHGKEAKRGGYVAFEPGLRTAILRRIETIREVDIALTEDRIVTYYQPIVRLDTVEIVGLEALARMKTKDGRILTAGQFMEAFSDAQIADRLTKRMLSQVAADIHYWLAEGIPFQHVGINLSMSDFRQDDLDKIISAAFNAEQVSLKHLVLEVTETVFMDGPDHDIARAVTRLRDQGMLVALDDFGTGYASLTHLLSFPVDIIKIDKSFVDRLLTDPPSSAIVEALIGMSQKLGMRIVAEGIECLAQAERLQELGCRLGQGFQFAKPADAARTTCLLKHFAQQRASGKSVDGQRAARSASRRLETAANTRRVC